MLNKIILSTLYSKALIPEAMRSDVLEKPETYTGWIYPVRYLLSMRYLKTKQTVLNQFRLKQIYPISDSDFKQALIHHLLAKKAHLGVNQKKQTGEVKRATFSTIFKAKFVYPLLVLLLGIGIYNVSYWHKQKRIENVLANYLPYYSDLLHRKLLLTHNDSSGSKAKIAAIDESIDQTQNKILNDLPEKNGIRSVVKEQLLKLKDPTLDSESIMLGFKSLNTVFDQHQQPYYLTPKSFTMPCSSLIDAPVEQMMMLKELESLMSNNKPELCRTTMMTTYKVDKRNQLFYNHQQVLEEAELPLFHVRRIDKVPAVDGALGLTFKERGIGSIILVDRIKNFARESILPALTFQGRNYIIPYWMQGYYDIEEAVTKAYKKDIKQIYPDKKDQRKVKSLIKTLIKDKNRMQNSKMQHTMQRTNSNNDKNIFGNGFDAISVMLGKTKKNRSITKQQSFTEDESLLLKKLEEALYPSIEYHEAYHQIDKKDWAEPKWLSPTFKGKLSDNAIDHAMEELGAYLSQLANTDQGHNIWLSKLLIFSLNPMTKGQAEFYASSIIFNTLEAIYSDKEVTVNYSATVEDKTRIFSTLLKMDSKELRSLSRNAYKVLFLRDAPNLRY